MTMLAALSHPSLQDCRRMFLRNYEVQINIDLFVPLAQSTPHADKLDEVVDYDFMRNTVAERMALGHVHLQETLCDDVVKAMLAHPHVRAARVSTMKPDVYPDCEGVGVEVFQIKDEA